jgi:hypothetical protein
MPPPADRPDTDPSDGGALPLEYAPRAQRTWVPPNCPRAAARAMVFSTLSWMVLITDASMSPATEWPAAATALQAVTAGLGITFACFGIIGRPRRNVPMSVIALCAAGVSLAYVLLLPRVNRN